jgi:TatD DNase family protein
MFVDSHAHLEGSRFDADRGEVIARALAAGVRNIVAVGTGDGPGTLDCAVRLSEQYGLLYATIGIHPHEAKLAKDTDFDELQQLAQRSNVIAWGEIGLDYY